MFEVKRRQILAPRPGGPLHPGRHPQRVPQVLHGGGRSADPLLGPAGPRGLPRRDPRRSCRAPTSRSEADRCASFVTSFAGLFEPRARRGSPSVDASRSRSSSATTRRVALDSNDQRDPRELPRRPLRRAHRRPNRSASTSSTARSRTGRSDPLDGQQRLTTLFLLHWYLASRTGRSSGDERLDALLVRHPTERPAVLRAARQGDAPADRRASPSRWITDQPWYLYVWRHDPTDPVDARDDRRDPRAVRRRRPRRGVATPRRSERSRHLLPPPADRGHGLGRGPLHQDELPREAAHRVRELQGQTLEALDESPPGGRVRAQDRRRVGGPPVAAPRRRQHRRRRVPELHRVRHRAVRVEAGRQRRPASPTDRSRRVVLRHGGRRPLWPNLDLLFDAFDTWVGEDIDAFFDALLHDHVQSTRPARRSGHLRHRRRTPTSSRRAAATSATSNGSAASGSCCSTPSSCTASTRRTDFPRRLRVLRNLLAASEDELPSRSHGSDRRRRRARRARRRPRERRAAQPSATRRRDREAGLPRPAPRPAAAHLCARGPRPTPRLARGLRARRRSARGPRGGLRGALRRRSLTSRCSRARCSRRGSTSGRSGPP